MKKATQNLAAICCGALLLFAACKKDSAKKTTCTSTLYGYTIPVTNMYNPLGVNSFGAINTTSAVLSSVGSYTSTVYVNQSAFNTTDNCYYTFETPMGTSGSSGPLVRITAGGAVTSLAQVGTAVFSSVTYNRVNGKMYCVKNGSLAEITLGTSTFTATSVATPVHAFMGYPSVFVGTPTVDNNTGNMYFATGGSSVFYIEKFVPGSSTSTVVATGTGGDILGLRFNKNDNMLYAIRQNSPATTYDFISINPSGGTVSTVTSLSVNVNPEFYSAVIDPCTNRYILSTMTATGSGFVLDQFNMSGAIVQTNTTPTLYQGLDVQY